VTDKIPILLLVDDDPNDEELARIALEATGLAHRIVIKRDGAEALSWIASLDEKQSEAWPRFVLLDLKLPKVTGLEVLAQLRADPKTKTLPVVVFTSSSEILDLTKSYELGANAYIRKPIDFSEYRKTVQDMGRFWITRNNPPPRTQGPST
jgi:two-component system response regulator